MLYVAELFEVVALARVMGVNENENISNFTHETHHRLVFNCIKHSNEYIKFSKTFASVVP